jgi:hypothetical protein
MGLKPQGVKIAPIWLIGDSDPKNWSFPDLEFVFDDRHPTIHNIWTSIIYKIQKRIYKLKSKIIDDDQFYIRNAIELASMRPGQDDHNWDADVVGQMKADYLKLQINTMKNSINEYKPKMVITFGAFAFEFIRRCYGIAENPFGNWDTKELKKQFIDSITNNGIIVPLLHRSISMGHFLSSHRRFSHDTSENNINGNYFEFVSEKLYRRMVIILKL